MARSNARKTEASVALGFDPRHTRALRILEHDICARQSLSAGEQGTADFAVLRIRKMRLGRHRGTPAMHHKTGVGPANKRVQHRITLRHQLPDHFFHARPNLPLKRGRSAGIIIITIQSAKTTGQRTPGLGQPAPHLSELDGRDRTFLRGFAPRPSNATAIRPPLRSQQNVAKMRRKQMPELVNGAIANLEKRALPFAKIDLRNRSPTGR